MPKLCLNMIVKNESDRILRALKSAAPHISCYAILDTGSSDTTVQRIEEFFRALNIPGKVSHGTFKDFSQARNDGLRAAWATDLDWDFALLMDADMELKVNDPKWLDHITGETSVDMFQCAGATHYANRRLVSRKYKNARYLGVTHEYLDVPTQSAPVPQDLAYFEDHADGSNRTEKYKRDIKLLLEGLKHEPNNERYFFYLAQSYRDAGEPNKAAEWYQKRVDAGGWDEERWCAQYNKAHAMKDAGNEAAFVFELLKAYEMRPSRAEVLYDLSKHYREKGDNWSSTLFSVPGMAKPRSSDVLFVNDFVYDFGCKEEFSIAGFYTSQKNDAFWTAHRLAIQPTAYTGNRDLARANLYHYLPKCEDIFKTFKWRKLEIPLDDHWAPLNPSVTVHDNKLVTSIRTVNYKMDYEGRYWIRATDGSANQSNPINTRNFLVELDDDLIPRLPAAEIIPRNMPAREWDLVIGLEDPRLFSWRGSLHISSTVRELNREGFCEQMLSRLERFRDAETFKPVANAIDHRVMRHSPRAYEKNWMPIAGFDVQPLRFMYRPGEIVDEQGTTIKKTDLPFATDSFCGGTQLISTNGGWLGLIHEARIIPGRTRRYYQHRFVFYDHDFENMRPSRPFVFHDREIEYAAGMCLHPTLPNRVVVSYGYQDNEARICSLDLTEIAEWIWGTPQ